jgi:hypothetical protein
VAAGPAPPHAGVPAGAKGGLGSGLLELALGLFDGALNGGEDRGVQAHLHALLGVDEVLRNDGGHQGSFGVSTAAAINSAPTTAVRTTSSAGGIRFSY